MNRARWLISFAVATFLVLATLGSVSSFDDPCADGSCAPADPCANGGCSVEPVAPPVDPCADGSCLPPDPCADGSCAVPDPCADGSCSPPVDPCADGSCLPPVIPPPITQPPVQPPSGGGSGGDGGGSGGGGGGDGGGDGGGGGGGTGDNAPSVTISVPASAAPGSQLSITVTGTDDVDVSQLLFYDANAVQLASFDCVGIQASCSATFVISAPSTVGASYTFEARAMDSAGQFSSFVSGSGTTTGGSGPGPTPSSQGTSSTSSTGSSTINVELPIQKLFIRSGAFPESDCLRPGESAWFVAQVENKGAMQKDVKFATTVTDLSIYSSDGPTLLLAHDSSAHWFNIEVPEDARSGMYYMQLEIGNNNFKRIVYRTFVVDSSC